MAKSRNPSLGQVSDFDDFRFDWYGLAFKLCVHRFGFWRRLVRRYACQRRLMHFAVGLLSFLQSTPIIRRCHRGVCFNEGLGYDWLRLEPHAGRGAHGAAGKQFL